MAEDIRGLIEKINQEGVQAAEKKAREIELQAQTTAREILERAEAEARRIVAEAKEQALRTEERGRTLLAQAGRDMLLSLKKEISATLNRVILTDVRQALNPEALAKIIFELVKGISAAQKTEIVVTLKEEDLEALKKAFLSKLKDEAMKEVVLKSSEEITGGFTISYDRSKSEYDFTDAALAEYIGSSLKPKLNQVLKDALSAEG